MVWRYMLHVDYVADPILDASLFFRAFKYRAEVDDFVAVWAQKSGNEESAGSGVDYFPDI